MAVTGQRSADEMITEALVQEMSKKGPEPHAYGLGKILRNMEEKIREFLERLAVFLS